MAGTASDTVIRISPHKKILTEFLDRVWAQGDVDAVDDYVADSYSIHNDPGDPWDGETLGREGFKDRLVRSRAIAPDQRFFPVEMIEEGDRIAVSWRWEATHSGDMPGLPATGRRIKMTGLTIYSFTGERLSGHWQLADRLGVYQQITGRE
jgi:predicted ester cyclase